MGAILGPNSVVLENLISHLLSSPEEIRPVAESIFNTIKQKVPSEVLALKLAELLGSSSHVINYRAMCVDLLQRLLIDNEGRIWPNLSVATQSKLKCILLDRIMVEESNSINRKLCSTISKLADSLFLQHNNWPELLTFLKESITFQKKEFMTFIMSNRSIKSSFLIFSELAQKTAESLVPDIKISCSVCQYMLDDRYPDLEVNVLALITVLKYIRCLQSLKERELFQNLLPAMTRTLVGALFNDEAVLVPLVLEKFIDLGKNDPSFFRTQLVDVIDTMLEIADDSKLEEKTRYLAIEFVLTLVEKEKAAGMMKKLPRFTSRCFDLLLKLLLDIKDEPCWHSAETNQDTTGRTNSYCFGKLCLKRLSNALGGKTIAPIAVEQLSSYLVSPEWEKRHAALIALSQTAEGCSKVMIKYLNRLMKLVMRCLQDDHPQIRWAAINVILQLSIDFSPEFQEQYHNQVLPRLAAAIDDFQNPRVQAHAASAVLYFCKSTRPETFVPYLDGILNKLLILLQNDNQMVQEAALFALACIAELSKEHSQKYYDFVMPYLKTILKKENDKSNYILRSKALECISFIGMAVGKEKFRDDLNQVMEVIKYSLQESKVKEFDTIINILQACFKICRCMGKDFLPYMSIVMPPLVECAQLELDKTIYVDELDNSMHKVNFGDGIICARGKDLFKGKAIACAILGAYALTLEEIFYPWISQAATILVPLLQFYIHDDVRQSASYALACLLSSAKLAVEKGIAQDGNESYFEQLSGCIILALGTALYWEPETKVCASILRDLNKCLTVYGPLLNKGQVHSIMDEIKHIIIESSRRKGELTERANAKGFDAELLREEREQEEEISSNAGEISITLIKIFKADFLPFLDELSSYLMPARGKDNTATEKITCISIFNILVEHCGEAALKYYNIYLPFLLDACNDDNPDVRQGALYGLGFCAEYGGSIFKPFIEDALSKINVVIMHSHALEAENLWAYYNAVSALSNICHFHQESIDSIQIFQAWLNCLPMKEDMVKAKVVHDQFCSMVERSDSKLLGPNYLHIPKVISVFVEVLCAGENLATEATSKRMINLLKHFQQTLPPATFASAYLLLLPQHKRKLEFVLST